MKQGRDLTLIETIAVAGFAVLLMSGGIYFYARSLNDGAERAGLQQSEVNGNPVDENNTGTESPSDDTEAVDTSGWEIYRNDEYKFEIRYPEEFGFEGENPAEKLLFSVSDGENVNMEFWIQNLEGKTLEQVFEEKLELEDKSYFDWVREQGGKITNEDLGTNSWLFIDGSGGLFLGSHFLTKIPNRDAYLIADLGIARGEGLTMARNILRTLTFLP